MTCTAAAVTCTLAASPAPALRWQDEAQAAAHGGLWRIVYAARSALGLAAVLGWREYHPAS
jgi:hypothetical protein